MVYLLVPYAEGDGSVRREGEGCVDGQIHQEVGRYNPTHINYVGGAKVMDVITYLDK